MGAPLQRSAASALPEGRTLPRAEEKSHLGFLNVGTQFWGTLQGVTASTTPSVAQYVIRIICIMYYQYV